MQTASVADRGRLRLGGQVSFAAYCGDYGNPGLAGALACADFPDGVPLPELRVDGRYGFAQAFDVGLSLLGQGTLFAVEKTVQLGATLDVKRELMRVPTTGPTHILSAGLLGGAAVLGRFGLPAWSQAEWGVPLYYGLQFQRIELVAGASLSERYTHSPAIAPSTTVTHLNFTLGVFRRDPAGFAAQIGYLTDVHQFTRGAVQLQLGVFFDML